MLAGKRSHDGKVRIAISGAVLNGAAGDGDECDEDDADAARPAKIPRTSAVPSALTSKLASLLPAPRKPVSAPPPPPAPALSPQIAASGAASPSTHASDDGAAPTGTRVQAPVSTAGADLSATGLQLPYVVRQSLAPGAPEASAHAATPPGDDLAAARERARAATAAAIAAARKKAATMRQRPAEVADDAGGGDDATGGSDVAPIDFLGLAGAAAPAPRSAASAVPAAPAVPSSHAAPAAPVARRELPAHYGYGGGAGEGASVAYVGADALGGAVPASELRRFGGGGGGGGVRLVDLTKTDMLSLEGIDTDAVRRDQAKAAAAAAGAGMGVMRSKNQLSYVAAKANTEAELASSLREQRVGNRAKTANRYGW